MCLAVPMKIIEVTRPTALGEAGGLTQSVRVDFIEDAAPGDYVIVHAGFAVERVTEEAAMESLRIMEEVKNAL